MSGFIRSGLKAKAVPLNAVSVCGIANSTLVRESPKERGLELSQEKTVITETTEGFDFLGQNVRKYTANGKLKLLITPSKKSIHSFKQGLTQILRKARHLTQAQLIHLLNPKIVGWSNYHRGVVSKRIFTDIDNFIWRNLY